VSPSLELATASAPDTRDLAAALAGVCRVGDVLLLSGDLGAGKTTFAQGFGRALGIEEPVTSPTFTLVRQYEVAPGANGVRTLLHADVYRLDNLGEIADLGLGQLVEDGGVALVEWGDAAAPVLGTGALSLLLEVDPDDEGRRRIAVTGAGAPWDDRWVALASALAPWAAGA
jgi:tRNA threonylcarbamoyladenosine biosynthesis protein TsaE